MTEIITDAEDTLFTAGDLSSQLEFSINIDMFSDKPLAQLPGRSRHSLSIYRQKSRSLRQLIRSHSRRQQPQRRPQRSKSMMQPPVVARHTKASQIISDEYNSDHHDSCEGGNDDGITRQPRSKRPRKAVDTNVTEFSLQLRNLPSPLASFSKDGVWGIPANQQPQTEAARYDFVDFLRLETENEEEEGVQRIGRSIDGSIREVSGGENMAGGLCAPQAGSSTAALQGLCNCSSANTCSPSLVPHYNRSSTRGETQSIQQVYTHAAPPPLDNMQTCSLDGHNNQHQQPDHALVDHQPESAAGLQVPTSENKANILQATDTPGTLPCSIEESPLAENDLDNAQKLPSHLPRRQSSLMFNPLRDAKAVGALIDAISSGNDDGKQQQQRPALAGGSEVEDELVETPATPQKKQRLLRSLRKIRRSVPSLGHKRSDTAKSNGAELALPQALAPPLPPPPPPLPPSPPLVSPSEKELELEQRAKDQNKDKTFGDKEREQPKSSVDKITAAAASAPLPIVPGLEKLSSAVTNEQGTPGSGKVRPRSATMVPGSSSASNSSYVPIAVSLKSTRSRQFLLNTPLGEFEVLKTLGQGSYGKVKLMRSALTNEQFAVKIIKRYPPHKHRRGHQEYRKAKTLDRRVVREANLAAILGQLHPHIVPLHDFRVTDTHFYLFYAFVNGVTLAERVGTHGLSEHEARAIFKPVVETISFCHQYSVIHRDIKLENVLIDYVDDVDKARPFMTGSSLALATHRSDSATPNKNHGAGQATTMGGAGAGAGGGMWAGVPVLGGLEGMIGRKNNNNNNNNTSPATATAAAANKKAADGSHHGASRVGSKDDGSVDYRSASVFDGCVKIIDFGLANFFDGVSLMETFCGSLPYTAPEILRGDAYVGPEIDVWSLGVLLYVMLTGQFPFEDPAQPKNFDRIMAGDFILRNTMSSNLQDILVRMLEPNSKQRITMQDILQHAWLQGDDSSTRLAQDSASARPMPSTATMVDITDRHHTPRPGICCPLHPFPIIDAIHDRRTLTLPAPHVDTLVAREVATCLDRSLDDIMRILEAAIANGERHPRRLGRNRHSMSVLQQDESLSSSSLASGHVLRWPNALQCLNSGAGEMVEVANSPVVSVYALIAQQIDMRRYYLELPMVERAPLAEPADGHQNAHKPPATQTNATQIQFAGDSADGSIADGGDEVDEEHKARQRQDALARLLRARPHNIFHRLSSQITSTLGGHSHSPEPGKKRISLPAKLPNNTPGQQQQTAPLPAARQLTRSNSKQSDRRWSMLQLPREPSCHGTNTSPSELCVPQPTAAAVTQPLKIRSIGVMEEMSTRITLPTDLTGIPAETVLGLVSRLLNLHMIAHTFVETRKMPVHKALDMSMFSLKTIAAMMSSVKTTNPGLRPTDAFHPPPTTVHDADNDTQDSDSIYVDASSIGAFTDPIVAATAEFPLPPQAPMPPPPSSADRNLSVLDIETGELHGNHRRTHHNLKALLSYMVPKGLRAATADTPSDDQAATANITDGGNKPSYFTKLTADPGSSPGGGGGPGKTGLSKLLLLGTHKRMSPPYQHRRRNSISDTTPSTRLTHNPAVDSCTTSGGQQGCSGDEPADSGVVGMPEIITTVPVQYATPVVFAQYSPSLNRWRETEVVEYYSCSVRIELVRIGGSESRHRYALLVDRMTGHKGKFALFRMFLRRMITALPMLEPEKFSPHMPLDPLITVM